MIIQYRYIGFLPKPNGPVIKVRIALEVGRHQGKEWLGTTFYIYQDPTA